MYKTETKEDRGVIKTPLKHNSVRKKPCTRLRQATASQRRTRLTNEEGEGEMSMMRRSKLEVNIKRDSFAPLLSHKLLVICQSVFNLINDLILV